MELPADLMRKNKHREAAWTKMVELFGDRIKEAQKSTKSIDDAVLLAVFANPGLGNALLVAGFLEILTRRELREFELQEIERK